MAEGDGVRNATACPRTGGRGKGESFRHCQGLHGSMAGTGEAVEIVKDLYPAPWTGAERASGCAKEVVEGSRRLGSMGRHRMVEGLDTSWLSSEEQD